MSGENYLWALQQKTGDPLSKFVLLLVADSIGHDDPSPVRISRLCNITEAPPRDVERALDHLLSIGLLTFADGAFGFPWFGAPQDVGAYEPKGRRKKIYERDGHKCVYCGSAESLSLDHVVPRSKGGSNSEDNLVTACQPCNSSKGAKDLSDWMGRK